jgi:hypothetical protein
MALRGEQCWRCSGGRMGERDSSSKACLFGSGEGRAGCPWAATILAPQLVASRVGPQNVTWRFATRSGRLEPLAGSSCQQERRQAVKTNAALLLISQAQAIVVTSLHALSEECASCPHYLRSAETSITFHTSVHLDTTCAPMCVVSHRIASQRGYVTLLWQFSTSLPKMASRRTRDSSDRSKHLPVIPAYLPTRAQRVGSSKAENWQSFAIVTFSRDGSVDVMPLMMSNHTQSRRTG